MFKVLILVSLVAFSSSLPFKSDGVIDGLADEIEEFIDELQDLQASAGEKYNLTYFSWNGRGEILRWLLAYADEDFVDNRIKYEEWNELKPTTPFGQLPILEVTRKDGEKLVLAQSKAIALYLADRFDLNGHDTTEEAFANMYGNQIGDLYDAYNNALANNKTQELFEVAWPTNFQFFENRLAETNTGFLAGDVLTWADIFLSQITDYLGDEKEKFLDSYPNVKTLDDRIRGNPNIAEWIESRPPNDFLWF